MGLDQAGGLGDAGAGDSWLGVPRVLDRAEAERLTEALDSLWVSQGTAAGAAGDSDIKKAWFDPLARGARLRAALDALPLAREVVGDLDDVNLRPPLVLKIGPDRLIVTLEGRALADLLRDQLSNSGDARRIRLRWSDTDATDAMLIEKYRELVLSKLDSVVRLRTGTAPPLLPQAIGQVLLLLLNGNIGADRGLRRPKSPSDQRAVDEAVAAMVSDFAERISPSKRGRAAGAYSLYSGYAMTEARRRLGSDLTLNPIAIAAGSRDRVIDRLITDLVRRGTSREDALDGLAALIAEYERRRPELALYGLAQGRPSDAAALRRAFADRYHEASTANE